VSDGSDSPLPARWMQAVHNPWVAAGRRSQGWAATMRGPVRVERQAVHGEAVHGRVWLVGVHHLARQHAVPGEPGGREHVSEH
jgi:hypothetical protein